MATGSMGVVTSNDVAPVFPIDIQLLVIESLVPDTKNPDSLIHDNIKRPDHLERIAFLWSWSVVCRSWSPLCQAALFSIIYVDNSVKLDKLHRVLCHPASSHLVQHVKHMAVHYHPPFYKLGEILPRIISMRLPNLIRIDLKGEAPPIERVPPPFPLHPSLLAQLSRLHTVRSLRLEDFGFRHIAELRRFISAFRGLRSVEVVSIQFGEDEMGDFRSLHQNRGVLRSTGQCMLGMKHLHHLWIVPFSNPALRHQAPFWDQREDAILPVISLALARLAYRILLDVRGRIIGHATWSWNINSKGEWDFVYHSSLNLITLTLTFWTALDQRNRSTLCLDLSDVKEISVTLSEVSWDANLEALSRILQDVIPRLLELGNLSRFAFALALKGERADREDGSDLPAFELGDQKTILFVNELLQEAEKSFEVHITIGGVPVRDFLKETLDARNEVGAEIIDEGDVMQLPIQIVP
ncbi:hypothetical protein NLI96_g9069 [Meripilus lineatus]|uniref:Uncharacterized protein n=1 Tax=Meripilus lineatus TaxID=2056292 RepID=A0AAD5UXT1_9APHY|nr:hypothetical protein NLI96_g9069 [Physisporinus lineatus]